MSEELLEALEIGLDAAQDVAAETHARYAGYKPHRHAAIDEAVRKIEAAIASLKAAQLAAPVAAPAQDERRSDAKVQVPQETAGGACAPAQPETWKVLPSPVDDASAIRAAALEEAAKVPRKYALELADGIFGQRFPEEATAICNASDNMADRIRALIGGSKP